MVGRAYVDACNRYTLRKTLVAYFRFCDGILLAWWQFRMVDHEQTYLARTAR